MMDALQALLDMMLWEIVEKAITDAGYRIPSLETP
jgi:hypothetical protein